MFFNFFFNIPPIPTLLAYRKRYSSMRLHPKPLKSLNVGSNSHVSITVLDAFIGLTLTEEIFRGQIMSNCLTWELAVPKNIMVQAFVKG